MAKKNYDNIEENEAIEPKKKGFKVKNNLGFENGKRSFFEGGRNILLIEGEIVSKEDYDLFSDRAQQLLFE